MFQIKVLEIIKTHILCSGTLFPKSCRLWDNVNKCGGAREAADNMAARSMPHARKHTSAPMHSHTHARKHSRAHAYTQNYVIFIGFPRKQWFREHASIYVICTLPLLVHTLAPQRHDFAISNKTEQTVFHNPLKMVESQFVSALPKT
jgi:hypothetical protein